MKARKSSRFCHRIFNDGERKSEREREKATEKIGQRLILGAGTERKETDIEGEELLIERNRERREKYKERERNNSRGEGERGKNGGGG